MDYLPYLWIFTCGGTYELISQQQQNGGVNDSDICHFYKRLLDPDFLHDISRQSFSMCEF